MRDNPEEIRFSDEYQEFRAYYLPASDLRFGSKNTIAVRVYDGFIDGGIYQGPIGITTREKYLDWKNTQSRDTFNIFEKLFGK
jgi:sialate O-acetylesterase